MKDREFIELLNLYVDREISPEDALRLEAEVGNHQGRRQVYDQYCRMQKACSMLSAQLAGAGFEGTERRVLAFPAVRGWRLGPVLAGLAAAACIVAVFGLRYRAALARSDSPEVAVAPGASRTVPDTMELALAPDPMRPVFTARVAGSPPERSASKPVFAMPEESPPLAQLNWIGDIHLTPVFSAANPDFLLAPKQDLKSGITDETPNGRPQEPSEMTAFRFQR